MTESTSTTERDADVFPVDALPSPRPLRETASAWPTPSITTPSPVSATDEQEHPVTSVLAPEAPPLVSGTAGPRRGARPVSVPSHRADVGHETVPTDPSEPRPASVARHSVDTSAITLPVFAPEVDASLPQPPDRLTLDDDVLVRMVERRLDDTATVDLMAVVQAQLQARRVEAARFASWAREMDRVGTDEAAEALERTRLRFTGVIDVVLPLDLDLADPASPDGSAEEPEPSDLRPASSGVVDVVSGGVDVAPAPSAPAPSAPVPTAPASASSAPAASVPASGAAEERRGLGAIRPSRALLLGAGAAAAAALLLAAVVLTVVDADLVASAVLATVAVPVAGGLGGAAALTAVSRRPDHTGHLSSRGPVAVVVGVLVAAVLGYGVLVTVPSALAWQGWLVRAVGAEGTTPQVAVVVALLVAVASAFVVTVLLTGLRSTSRR